MRVVFLVLSALLMSCQTCPDGNATNSLFCHGADCLDDETVCGGACANLQNDRDNCGACGNACGDGLVCSFSQCVEGCDNGLVRCGDVCVDVTSDVDNCMTCGTTCAAAQNQSCNNGVCGCAADELTCGAGVCTDPTTDKDHCGATGDCLGANAGEVCDPAAACIGGQCLFATIYRGSLPASLGRWNYRGVLGLDGANMDCEAHFPGSAVCTFAKMELAESKGELVNAVDYNNVPVQAAGATTSLGDWWIDDPTATGPERCQDSTAENIPWTYATAHLGNGGKYVTLDRPNGQIGPLMPATIPTCNSPRFVACCSINIQP